MNDDPPGLLDTNVFLHAQTHDEHADECRQFLLTVLNWPSVRGEKGLMVETVQRWASTPGLSFVDAYLATLALSRSYPVYTKNIRDLTGQGATAPNPLPAT